MSDGDNREAKNGAGWEWAVLPCPFCGHPPTVKNGKVKCLNETCKVQPRTRAWYCAGHETSAIADWNKMNHQKHSVAIEGSAPPSDADRLKWCLKYGHAKTLGGAMCADDLENHAITLDMIDREIIRDRAKERNDQALRPADEGGSNGR